MINRIRPSDNHFINLAISNNIALVLQIIRTAFTDSTPGRMIYGRVRLFGRQLVYQNTFGRELKWTNNHTA